jgi:hypothetical protein
MTLKKIILITIIFNFSHILCSQTKNIVLERRNNGILFIVNIKTGKHILKDKNNRIIFENLRGLKDVGNGYQAINSKNELIYFSLKKDTVELKSNINEVRSFYSVCGTVPNYKISIKDTLNHFEIILKTDNTWLNQENTISTIATISKIDADDCYFTNYEKEFSYENYPSINRILNIQYENPDSVIFKKNNRYGIWKKTEAVFDEIKIVHLLTKIKKDNLYSYYEINKTPKYKELGDFIGAYARFELTNGKKGYLTSSDYYGYYEYIDE